MILMIDNYDSFTFNIVDYLAQLGKDIKLIKNDEMTIEELKELEFSHLVVGPGPSSPVEAGICLEAIKFFAGKKPILGVCLGHQAIANAFGGKVVKASQMMHGKISKIEHNKDVLFNDIPKIYEVARFHSLVADKKTFSPDLEILATSCDEFAEIMALKHKQYNIYGIQYHPESIASSYGMQIFKNFLNIKEA